MSIVNDDSLDWVRETPESIDARLAGAKQVQDRIGFVLAVMAVISMMILIASYNAYLSYDYEWARDQSLLGFASEKNAPDILREQALRSWADSRNVMISIVGIRVNVDDAPVLGTLSLFVASLWLLLLVRRENRTIGFLLRDTDSTVAAEQDPEIAKSYREKRWLIFHSIISNSVFMNLDRSMARVQSLRGPMPGSSVRPFEERISRALGAFFFVLPPLACLVMFGLDRWSYFRPSPFRPGAEVPAIGGFFWSSTIVFFCCWVPLLVCCLRARLYMTATEAVLREYRDSLFADHMRTGQERESQLPPSRPSQPASGAIRASE